MRLLYLYLLHRVCLIYMYINVFICVHTHCEPWHNHVHGLAMGLVTSHRTWILGNTTVRMSNLADLCMLYSTLKWWEDNDFLCYQSNILSNQVAKCLCLSFFLSLKEEYRQGFCVHFMLQHSVFIIHMYINVCIHMHTHCEPWHHHVHGLAMGLVTSHHARILGKITARMSNLADLCMLYSTLTLRILMSYIYIYIWSAYSWCF